MSPQTQPSAGLERFRSRIEARTAKVGIIGLGYVGLPLALLFNEERFPVTGFDVDAAKVHALNDGRSYIYRIPKTEIAAARSKGFSATGDYSQVADMDAIIICVPTPLNEYREPDLSYIRATVEAIAPHLPAGQLVVLESTTYPGTTGAEMTKLLENIYRCVNIALVNELKLLSLRMNIDIWEVIQAASTKPFGFHPFYPGPGLGGHCIPVDPFYLSWKAREFDFQTRFIEVAGEINSAMPYHVVTSVATALNRHKKSLNGSKVLVLGVAYKRDIDDLRESPALTIIEELQKQGAEVSYNDPYFPTVGRGRKYNLQMTCAPLDNLSQYDCVLIVTDHSDYDYPKIVKESQLVVDTRNATKGIKSEKIVRC